MEVNMGLKIGSQPLNIGGQAIEAVANTFTTNRITLPLNTLERQVFVVTDMLFDSETPDSVAAGGSRVLAQVTKTEQAAMLSINDPTVVGFQNQTIVSDGAGNCVAIEQSAPGHEYSTGDPKRDYITVISTPDFFVSIQGTLNNTTSSTSIRLRGFMAVATADVYAALVTEELNA